MRTASAPPTYRDSKGFVDVCPKEQQERRRAVVEEGKKIEGRPFCLPRSLLGNAEGCLVMAEVLRLVAAELELEAKRIDGNKNAATVEEAENRELCEHWLMRWVD
jgi:hypothetical protein